MRVLAQYLGDVEAERFIVLIQREPFDYTKWRQNMEDRENKKTGCRVVIQPPAAGFNHK
jgi:hypothetical protein